MRQTLKILSVDFNVRKYPVGIVALAAIVLLWFLPLEGKNTVSIVSEDPATGKTDRLELKYRGLYNDENTTGISMELSSDNVPFTINKVEWRNCDSTFQPLEPFFMAVSGEDVAGKNVVWQIDLEFPHTNTFSSDDVLLLHTDRGIVRCPTTREGILKESIDLMNQQFTKEISDSRQSTRKAWLIVVIVLCAAVLGGGIAYLIVRRKFILKKKETERLLMLISEGNVRNKDLEEKVNQLYGSRLNTLNMLCNEYFEKNDSEKVRLSLYNEVEKHILSLRDRESVTSLEAIVNRYVDNILVRVREQLPELSANDLSFLTYLYAGFSPRAVCIFTDIKIKNFYNRRSRLKDRILNSDAPDKEFFVSKM